MHLAVGVQQADKALVVLSAADVEVANGMSVAAEFTGKALGGVANGRPQVAGQLNVPGQQTLDVVLRAAVHRLGKPRQLRAGADLVYAALVLCGFLCLLAIPGALACLCKRQRKGQHTVFHLVGAGGFQGKGAGCADITSRPDIIVIGVIGQVLVNAVFGGKLHAVAVCQRRCRPVYGIAVLILCTNADIIGQLLHRDRDVHQMAGQHPQQQRRKVGGHALVRHFVHEVEGVGGAIHIAGNMSVAQHKICGICAVFKLNVLGNGEFHRSIVHLRILRNARSQPLSVSCGIGHIQVCGVKYAGHLVDAPVQAVKGHPHLAAGHKGLAGERDILQLHRHRGHPYQAIAYAGGVGHAEDHRAASPVTQRVKGGQRHHILAAFIGRDRREVRQLGLQVCVGSHKGVFHLGAAGAVHSKVQGGGCVLVVIEPGIKAVIPLSGAGRTGPGQRIVAHHSVRRAVLGVRTGHHGNGHTLGICSREQAAHGAMIQWAYINAVIIGRKDRVLGAGLHIHPVASGVAAIEGLEGSVAGENIPVEVRLYHDVGHIGADKLPITVGAQAGHAVQHLVSAGIQVHLDVRLVPVDHIPPQVAEVVGQFLRVVGIEAIRKGQVEGVFVLYNVLLAIAAGARHMGRIAEPPGVVIASRFLFDLISSRLGPVAVVLPVYNGGKGYGVKVVALQVKVEGGVRRHHIGHSGRLA